MQQTLLALLSDGRTQEAITQLRQLTAGDKHLHEQVLLLAARFAEKERQKHAGTIGPDALNIEQNKINAGLLSVIHQLPDGAKRKATSKWLKIGGGIATAIALLAGIAEISGYSVKDFFTKEKDPPPLNQSTTEPSKEETAPPPQTTPGEKPVPAAEMEKTEVKRNHFESHDSSQQINIPDNEGTININ